MQACEYVCENLWTSLTIYPPYCVIRKHMNLRLGTKLRPKGEGDRGALATLGLAVSGNPNDNDVVVEQIDAFGSLWSIVGIALALGTIPGLLSPEAVPANFVQAVALLSVPTLTWFVHKTTFFSALHPVVRSRIYIVLGSLIGILMAIYGHDIGGRGSFNSGLIGLFCAVIVVLAGLSRIQSVALACAAGLMATLAALSGSLLLAVLTLPLLACHFLIATRLLDAEFVSAYQRLDAEGSARRSKRLLDEFEANGSGWFWECDKKGNILYISDKFVEAVGFEHGQLNGKPISSVVTSGMDDPEGLSLSARTLTFHLSTRTAFSEVPVSIVRGGKTRWWSMSGRPVIDNHGQFRGFIGTGTDITAQRNSDAEITRLARFDPLTGLANRAETGKILERALTNQAGTMNEAGLFLLDLDRFKNVNDTLGHPAGDELLKQVSERLVHVVGRAGQVGRQGGDEFKIIFPNITDRTHLAGLANAVTTELSKNYEIQGTQVSIGASIGIAIAPVDGRTGDELVRNADLALYAAKAAGRGTHRFYQQEMHSLAIKRRETEDDMRVALREGQFHLVYQPVVGLREEKLSGFEALIRWNHPVRGMISPAEFIPIAEESGLIEPIGEWVLRTATLEAAQWAVPARVAVNVSAIQFANPNFGDLVANVLAQSGLAPQRLELEITESVFVEDDAATSHQFDLLKRLNIRLALDDFGTGYSSLGYLKKAPFDKIKIDQSFVRGATLNGSRNVAIIKAIVSMADSLGMETTAEGAETQDEIVFIRELGCSHIQGFVYGPPIPAHEVRRRLGTNDGKAEAVGYKRTRSPRQTMLRSAVIRHDGIEHHARIRNISTTGVNLEFEGEIPFQSVVEIEIADGPLLTGNVRWMRDGRSGIQFDHPLNLTLLNSPMRRVS